MKVTKSSIIIHQLRVYAYHGVDPQERVVGAYFLIDLHAHTDFSQAMHTDRLDHTVSYAQLCQAIRQEMATPSELLEQVAGRILQRLFHDFPALSRISLTLYKQNPPMGADCQGAGISVEAER